MAAPQPQAEASPAYTPVITDLWRLVRAPFVPRTVYEEQRDKPTVWMPWVVVSALFVILGVVAMPYTIQVAKVAAEAQGRPWTPAAESVTKVFTMVGTPIFVLIGLAIGGAVLYLLMLALGSQPRFKAMMCICVFAVPVTFIQTVVTTVALMSRGVNAIQTPYDARISFGLDNLVSAEFATAHKAMAALLRGIGPFEIWGLVITAFGLIYLERAAKNKAWTAAIIAFVVGLVIKAGFAMLTPG